MSLVLEMLFASLPRVDQQSVHVGADSTMRFFAVWVSPTLASLDLHVKHLQTSNSRLKFRNIQSLRENSWQSKAQSSKLLICSASWLKSWSTTFKSMIIIIHYPLLRMKNHTSPPPVFFRIHGFPNIWPSNNLENHGSTQEFVETHGLTGLTV